MVTIGIAGVSAVPQHDALPLFRGRLLRATKALVGYLGENPFVGVGI